MLFDFLFNKKKVAHRHSYGVIPIIGTPELWEVLLIEQRDPFTKDYWTLPKGTPETGETPRETAVRETYEEVGIMCDVIDEQFSYTDSYTFTRYGVEVRKSVTYFVGRAPHKNFKLQEKEVLQAKWCSFPEAIGLMKFKDKNDIFQKLVESGAPSRLLGK